MGSVRPGKISQREQPYGERRNSRHCLPGSSHGSVRMYGNSGPEDPKGIRASQPAAGLPVPERSPSGA
jgi:hypothetical protein